MAFYLMVAGFLNKILLAHSASSAEREHAEELLCKLSDGDLTRSQARLFLDTASADFVIPRELMIGLDREARFVFLRLAIDVALVDDHISAHELHLLHELADHLLIPPSVVDHLLQLLAQGAEADQTAVRKACAVLGVKPDDDVSVIRAAHRRLIREHHPDRFPEHQRAEATKRASEINAAYDLLIGAN